MKKTMVLVLICLFVMAGVLMAQPAQPAAPSDSAATRSYMAIGMHLPFMYFIEAEDGSMEQGGITLKAPISKTFGVQFSINKLIIPIKEYEVGPITRKGFGEEEFTNFQIGLLYFMPFQRYLQAKVGVDYFKFDNGYIAEDPGTGVPPTCGTMYSHCTNCAQDLYGVFLGLGLDVPIYERFLIMTGLSYHYVLNDHPSTKKGFVNFNLGIGYRI